MQKEKRLVKKYKKSCKKLLTKPKRSDNICKHSSRETREQLRDESEGEKRGWKKLKKVLKKPWQTKRYVIYSLSCLERAANWTLKIKQRDKKRNPRFDSTRYYQTKSFKKYFSNSNTEAKLAKYKRNVSKWRMSEQALKMIRTSKDVLIQFLESLILAQDERWRRA